MILLFWRGRGFLVPILAAIAMFTPIIVLRQIDGALIDRAVGLTMGLVSIVTFVLGLRWNRDIPKGEPALHSFCRLPLQYWAIPMLIFALLLGTRIITTEEGVQIDRQPIIAAGKDKLS